MLETQDWDAIEIDEAWAARPPHIISVKPVTLNRPCQEYLVANETRFMLLIACSIVAGSLAASSVLETDSRDETLTPETVENTDEHFFRIDELLETILAGLGIVEHDVPGRREGVIGERPVGRL